MPMVILKHHLNSIYSKPNRHLHLEANELVFLKGTIVQLQEWELLCDMKPAV